MNLRWLMRMAMWVRRPPSRQQIILAGIVIAASLAIVAVEYAGLWPEAFTAHRMRP
jgi:hypothetical protein